MKRNKKKYSCLKMKYGELLRTKIQIVTKTIKTGTMIAKVKRKPSTEEFCWRAGLTEELFKQSKQDIFEKNCFFFIVLNQQKKNKN